MDPDTPVIVFGYSYGGNLAAWFKQDYPHAAVGTRASYIRPKDTVAGKSANT